MRFLFVRSEVCPLVSWFPASGFLQILPHGRHLCLRLYPYRYRADSGLSSVRNVRRRAHYKKRAAIATLLISFRTQIICRLCSPCLNSLSNKSCRQLPCTLLLYSIFFYPSLDPSCCPCKVS